MQLLKSIFQTYSLTKVHLADFFASTKIEILNCGREMSTFRVHTMSFTYGKVISSITESTIWLEDHPTRIVWFYFIAKADRHGRIFGSLPGLANHARVTLKELQTAVDIFMSPDPHSRTKDHEGRRIKELEGGGGFVLLNHGKYRKLRDEEARKEYKRNWMRDKRANKKEAEKHGVTLPDVDTVVDKVDTSGTMLAQCGDNSRGRGKYIKRESEGWRLDLEMAKKECIGLDIPAEFISTIWHELKATGQYTDYRGHEIKDWPSFVRMRYEKSLRKKIPLNVSKTNGKPKSKASADFSKMTHLERTCYNIRNNLGVALGDLEKQSLVGTIKYLVNEIGYNALMLNFTQEDQAEIDKLLAIERV